jgi:hypothetical protein
MPYGYVQEIIERRLRLDLPLSHDAMKRTKRISDRPTALDLFDRPGVMKKSRSRQPQKPETMGLFDPTVIKATMRPARKKPAKTYPTVGVEATAVAKAAESTDGPGVYKSTPPPQQAPEAQKRGRK